MRRLVGYGSMLAESLVGVMAMIAAATLDPGVYFAMNVGAGDARSDLRKRRAGDRAVGLHDRPAAARCARRADGRGDAAVTHGRRAEPRGRNGRHPRQRVQRARAGALVSLRDHVRGGLHPHDDRCRHEGRALHAAGAARSRLGAARHGRPGIRASCSRRSSS